MKPGKRNIIQSSVNFLLLLLHVQPPCKLTSNCFLSPHLSCVLRNMGFDMYCKRLWPLLYLQGRHAGKKGPYEAKHYKCKFFGLRPGKRLSFHCSSDGHAFYKEGCRSKLAGEDEGGRGYVGDSHFIQDEQHAAAQAVACCQGSYHHPWTLLACITRSLVFWQLSASVNKFTRIPERSLACPAFT